MTGTWRTPDSPSGVHRPASAVGSVLSEREVQLVWLLGLFRRERLLAEDGRRLEVRFAGFPAGEGGPDFRGARIVLDGDPREGDVEVHLTPAGWRRHGHAADAGYAGVILHVALRRDSFDRGTRGMKGAIPELILEPYLDLAPAEIAARLSRPAPPPAREESMEALGEERVEARMRALRRLAGALGTDGAFYRELMVGLGYKNNKPGFAELARLVPWTRIRGRGAVEAADLYREAARGVAWRRPGRPANHPRRRLDGWSRFIGSVGNRGLLEVFAAPLENAESRFDPDGVGLIGRDRAHDLTVNAVLPALLIFGTGEARAAARGRLRGPDAGLPNRKLREAAAALGMAIPQTVIGRLGLLEWRARQ